ncbi:MAG: cytidine deaminase [Acidimicrobiia bacterium]
MSIDIDWDLLRSRAVEAATHAYAPYSQFHVGAAAVTTDGRIVAGCNVENASYGLTVCAEVSLVSALHLSGGGRLAGIVVVAGDGQGAMPCGRCRQVLLEHGGGDLLVDGDGTIRRLDALLPFAITPDEIVGRAEEGA